jgi:hypothetical protein
MSSGESIRMKVDEIYPYVLPKLTNQSLTKEDVVSALNELEEKNESEGKPKLIGMTERAWMMMGVPMLAMYINSKSGGYRKSRRNRRRRNKSRKNRR